MTLNLRNSKYKLAEQNRTHRLRPIDETKVVLFFFFVSDSTELQFVATITTKIQQRSREAEQQLSHKNIVSHVNKIATTDKDRLNVHGHG